MFLCKPRGSPSLRLVVSTLTAAHTLWKSWQDRRGARPRLAVHVQPWYGAKDHGPGLRLERLEVTAINTSTSPTTVTHVGAEPVDVDAPIRWIDHHATVAPNASFSSELRGQWLLDIFSQAEDLHDGDLCRVDIDGFDYRGEPKTWQSSPVVVQ
jgi:hypothetical protein